jgi:hypothetical protein
LINVGWKSRLNSQPLINGENVTNDKKKHHIPEVVIDIIGMYFLEAARHLREIQDEAPDEFVDTVKQLRIGLRKAYALASIDRSFHTRNIERERLRKIGWTKLAMLAPIVDDDNVETLLSFAEEMPSHALARMVRGETVDLNGRIVALYLDTESLALFEQVIERFGAVRAPRGWLRKETALVKAMQKVMADGS